MLRGSAKAAADFCRIAAAVALFAVVFHGLLPWVHIGIRQAQAAQGIEQVVLCSALGFRIVALKDGLPVDADPEKPLQAAQNCPFCFGPGNGQPAILPVGAALAVPGLGTAMPYNAAPQSRPAQSVALPPQARAPPAFRS